MTSPKIRPIHDRVIVRRLMEEDKSAGGLYIPSAAKEKSTRGEVVAVGPGKANSSGNIIPMQVKVGDVVLFGKYVTEIHQDEELIVLKEDEILAVIETE